ncbi:hypothetical protein PS706_05900 [Pseudomonas fluorescens]|nr:hypothetical protein PS706_05900 [Pseudomonas fluorescens]
MPAQLEEVMGQAHTLDAKNIGPDRRNLLLPWRNRCLPGLLHRAAIGFGQRLAVKLAVGVQRHAVEEDQVRRHHVIGQLLTQGGLERFARRSLFRRGQRLGRYEVGHQLVVGGQQEGFAHRLLGQQQRFDLTQLDTEPADFDLMVDATDIFDHPVSAITRQVTGAVKTLAQGAERVGDKTFGSQARALQVITGQATGTGNVQLTHGAHRQQVKVRVQHIQAAPRQRAANRAGRRTHHGVVIAAIEHAGHHRGLGRPVGIEQAYMPQPRASPQHRAIQRHRFAADMHLAQCAIGPWHRCQAILQEQFPIGRGQVGQGDALVDNLPVQVRAVPQLRPAQHDRRAQGQGRVQLLDKAIEVKGRELQYAVVRDQARILGRDTGEFAQCRMADGNAFWLAGGAGGVDDIRQAAGLERGRRVVLGTLRQLRVGQVDLQRRQIGRQWQAIAQVGLGQHQAHTTVIEHMHQAFTRVFRVKRHVGTTRLEHRQQADHHGKGALDRDPHQHFRAYALGDQVVCQAIGLAVQFTVAERLVIQGQRLARRMFAGLGLEQLVHGMRCRDGGGGIPVLEHPLLFGCIEHRQRAKTAAWCTHCRLEQVLPMLRQAFDGCAFEQVGGIGQRRPEAFSGLMGVQAQVEMRGLVFPIQLRHPQAG